MSGEDDAFDIDIYGDEDAQEQEQEQQAGDVSADIGYTYDDSQPQAVPLVQTTQEPAQVQPSTSITTSSPPLVAPTGPSLKRKAPDDEDQSAPQPTSQPNHSRALSSTPQNASGLSALKMSDLNWWTTEEDLRAFCAAASTESLLLDLSFGEHKPNGKSRGEAYLEFSSAAAASATKREIERSMEEGVKRAGGGLVKEKFKVWFVPVGNMYKGKEGGVGDRKFGGAAGKFDNQGGAYNASYANRGGAGGFARGGRGTFNPRGNFANGNFANGNNSNNTNNGMMGRGNNFGAVNSGWGMQNGGAASAGNGYAMNSMMGNYNPMTGFNPMAMGMTGGMNGVMGGYGGMMGMGRGMVNPMMGGMMAGAGQGIGMNGMGGMNGMSMGGMGMGGMNGMVGRGGASAGGGGMMGRGGWAGGAQGVGLQGQQQQMGGVVKKPRTE